ncbi:MAG: hypothetical protein IPP27_02760 [Bacteroidetes bacterium]|nr:hypothetical protein [Bacteroidota bacterium]
MHIVNTWASTAVPVITENVSSDEVKGIAATCPKDFSEKMHPSDDSRNVVSSFLFMLFLGLGREVVHY